MRIAIAILLALALLVAVAGCAEKPEQTKAVRVENPAEEAAPEETAEAKAPEPVVEAAKPEAKPDAKGFITTSSGLKYKDKKAGSGTAAKAGDIVTVHYKGWLDDGTVFDTSRKEGREPFVFSLGQGQVIPGWDEGVAGMKKGTVRELIIPSELGYGAQGQGSIPPNATLHFEVELLKIGQ